MQTQGLADMNVFDGMFSSPGIFDLNLSFHNMRVEVCAGGPLGCEPRMGEALGCGGSPFRHQVQHGQQEGAEGVCLIFGPLILFYQHVK